ncbi:RodZ domain-containing protein [Vibrio gallicus]|uniref:RodZ domain-containing protein n=1 Tax=Vibrio gallicus TaxID=190897 RepID=UPI0021C463C8|nr:RodZ domain-containing protein [Vibrio gallicus]
MTTDSANTDTEKTDETPKIMLGEILKTKRESLGLSTREVGDRLRLRVAIIDSIEANDFHKGQVHTFTRGYIRSYAKLVGVDEKSVLDIFDSLKLSASCEEEMQSFSQKTQKKKHDNRIMKLTWGIFAVIVGISAIWWWQNEQNVDVVAEQPAQQEVQQLDSTPAEPEVTDEAIATETGSASEDLTSVSAADSSLAIEKPTQLPAVIPPAISMSFKADCWIKVSDAQGKTLHMGVKKSGDSLKLEGQGPFKFVVGAPEAVSLSISGEPFDLSGYTAGKVARFTAE